MGHDFRALIHVGFDVRPLAHFPLENAPNRLRNIHAGQGSGGAVELRPGEKQQFVHESRHVLHFFLHTLDILLLIVLRTLVQNSQRNLNPRDGGAEFVGDVAEKPPLAVHKTGETLRHAIDGFTQLAEFVAAAEGEPGFKFAFGNRSGSGRELGNGVRQTSNQRQPASCGNQNHYNGRRQPGRVVEEKRIRPQRREHPHQRGPSASRIVDRSKRGT